MRVQPPSAEDEILRESFTHERSEAGDDYDDQGLADTTSNGGENVAGMDWEERITTLLYRPVPANLSGKSQEAHSAPADQCDDYRPILMDAEARAWLFSTLGRDLALRGVVPSAMQAIRQTVLETFRRYESRDPGGKTIHMPRQRQRISRNRDPQIYIAHFKIGWDPVAFLDQEFSERRSRELISQIITVTGDSDNFQALPCQDYMIQTWPLAAPDFLALIQGLAAEPHKLHEGKTVSLRRLLSTNDLLVRLRGGSWLTARLDESCLCLDARGIDFEIAEIAEQLAWLGSALQPPSQSRYCICEPNLSTFFPYEAGHELEDVRRRSSEPYFHIEFLQLPLTDCEDSDSSHCWKNLFGNMTIARGFPIPSRPSVTPGLQIPLDVAADIIGAEKVVLFKNRLLIKGFSAMLYSTKVDFEDGTISWHLLESDNGSRISYADPRVGNGFYDGVGGLRYEDLQTARNIIGWCQNVENVTGK